MRPTIRWAFFGVFFIALSFLTLKSSDVRAFTLIESICKTCDPAVLSSLPAATKPIYEECCKCHKPCTDTPGGAPIADPDFSQCVDKKETCQPSACTSDADCPDPVANDCKGRKCDVPKGACVDTVLPNCVPPCDKTPPPSECGKDATCEKDGDPCTAPHCNLAIGDAVCPDGTKWGFTVGKCGAETPIAGCTPQSCSGKYPGDGDAIKCCEYGFDADPMKFKCCRHHLKFGEDPGTPAKPVPCNGNETCPTCPDCNPPVIDCSVIADPTLKSCCQAKGGMLYFVMSACAKTSDDCNIIVNIGGDVNGQLNICCNVLNNTGTITGTTVEQACNNTNIPGGSTAGATTGSGTGTPTVPASLGICEVKCKDVDCKIAVDTAGQGVGWVVSYSPPPDVGPVASVVLKQLEGPALTAEEPAAAGGGALSIKTITDPANLPPFIVYTPKPTSMMGEYLPKFKVAVQLNDLADHELATLTCEQQTALEAKGGGSGCGCSMTAQMTTRDQLVAYAVMLALFFLPTALLRRARKSSSK